MNGIEIGGSKLLLSETEDIKTTVDDKQKNIISKNDFDIQQLAGCCVLNNIEKENVISSVTESQKPPGPNSIASTDADLPEEEQLKSFPESTLFTEPNASNNKNIHHDLEEKPFIPTSVEDVTESSTKSSYHTEHILNTPNKENINLKVGQMPSQSTATLSSLEIHSTVNEQHNGSTEIINIQDKEGKSTLLQSGIFQASIPNVNIRNDSLEECLKQASFSASDIEAKDPLETLANAALRDATNNRNLKEALQEKETVWYDIGTFKGTTCNVTSYYAVPPIDQDHNNVTSDNLPNYTNALKVELEPGTAYKFRICAVNSCGRGPWSDISLFRTSLPGYPGAPSSVTISRSTGGALLSWQPPSNPAGIITEYTVCLAVKNPAQIGGVHTGQKLTLMKVYTGPQTQTLVSNFCLAEAYIDNSSSKPAIIFRIAARNEKGFGPPTQVRWLQDTIVPNTKGKKF